MVNSEKKEIWELTWGREYSPVIKNKVIYSALEALDDADKIGDVVVDVGSGADPMSGHLLNRPRKIIELDLVGGENVFQNTLKLELDINKISENCAETRRALSMAGQFLGVESVQGVHPKLVDTMIFSQILNYVDFKSVLTELFKYLKSKGRVIVFNAPLTGFSSQFSQQGLVNNSELYKFLDEQGFVIETLIFPDTAIPCEKGEEMIFLVAQKAGK